jgi:hypothetical protein
MALNSLQPTLEKSTLATASSGGPPQNTPTAGGVTPTDAPPVPLVSKEALLVFIGKFLGGVRVVGFQAGFGHVPDQILFVGPKGSTLAVPWNVLFGSPEEARELVIRKIQASQIAFDQAATVNQLGEAR